MGGQALAKVRSSSTDHWSYASVPYFTALIRPDGVIRKSAGSPKGPPAGESQSEVTVRQTAHRCSQGPPADEAERGFDAELFVKRFLRIADHQERDIVLVGTD